MLNGLIAIFFACELICKLSATDAKMKSEWPECINLSNLKQTFSVSCELTFSSRESVSQVSSIGLLPSKRTPGGIDCWDNSSIINFGYPARSFVSSQQSDCSKVNISRRDSESVSVTFILRPAMQSDEVIQFLNRLDCTADLGTQPRSTIRHIKKKQISVCNIMDFIIKESDQDSTTFVCCIRQPDRQRRNWTVLWYVNNQLADIRRSYAATIRAHDDNDMEIIQTSQFTLSPTQEDEELDVQCALPFGPSHDTNLRSASISYKLGPRLTEERPNCIVANELFSIGCEVLLPANTTLESMFFGELNEKSVWHLLADCYLPNDVDWALREEYALMSSRSPHCFERNTSSMVRLKSVFFFRVLDRNMFELIDWTLQWCGAVVRRREIEIISYKSTRSDIPITKMCKRPSVTLAEVKGKETGYVRLLQCAITQTDYTWKVYWYVDGGLTWTTVSMPGVLLNTGDNQEHQQSVFAVGSPTRGKLLVSCAVGFGPSEVTRLSSNVVAVESSLNSNTTETHTNGNHSTSSKSNVYKGGAYTDVILVTVACLGSYVAVMCSITVTRMLRRKGMFCEMMQTIEFQIPCYEDNTRSASDLHVRRKSNSLRRGGSAREKILSQTADHYIHGLQATATSISGVRRDASGWAAVNNVPFHNEAPMKESDHVSQLTSTECSEYSSYGQSVVKEVVNAVSSKASQESNESHEA